VNKGSASGWFGIAVLLGSCALAQAAGTLSPYVAEDVEHNTNVFDLSKDTVKPVGKDGPTFADTFFGTRVGVDGTYTLDRQGFYGTAEFRRFQYDNFTYLDHNETLFDGGLNWVLNSRVNGNVDYRHEQRMVLFQDVIADTQLILETENTANVSFNVLVNPEWRLETLVRDHDLSSPRVAIPGLSVHEDTFREGIKYLGVSNLSAGLEFNYLNGKYKDDPVAIDPSYHQYGLALAAAYKVTGLTNFTGDLGYTKRTDPTDAGLSGITGSLGYQHSLSAKTTVNVNLNRTLSTYVTTGGNEVDSVASVGLNYQLTYKILLKAAYSYDTSKFPGTPLAGGVPGTFERVDHFQTANVELTYQILHWLSIRPYARYQSRHSNELLYGFNSNVVGVELIARPPRPNR
jgi:hypothetical protein